MKMYNAGDGYTGSDTHGVPTIQRVDGEYVRIPRTFTGVPVHHKGDHQADQYVKHIPGQVYIAFNGNGFYAVPRWGEWEVPAGVLVEDVKAVAPHMVTEGEYTALKAQGKIPEPKKQEVKAPSAEKSTLREK